jgi:hypothetical protein
MAASSANKAITTITLFVGYAVILLTFLAGVQLFLLSEQTEQYFAWTIGVPLTAASLGAGYWAALVPTMVGIRGKMWINIRIIVVMGFTATVMMLLTTVLHLDRFHHTQPVSLAWLAGWIWIVIYIITPFMFLWLMFSQWRAMGDNTPRLQPLPRVAQWIFILQAFFGIGTGLLLFLMPDAFMSQWAWALTPLTARAIGTWMTASGVGAAAIAFENDYLRSQGTLYGFVAFGLLELVAFARYIPAVNWSSPLSWLYVVYMASHVLLSGYLLWTNRKSG